MLSNKFIPPSIPGPEINPKLGIYQNYINFFEDPIGFTVHLNKKYGNIVSIAKNNPNIIFLFGKEFNEKILSNPDIFNLNQQINNDNSLEKLINNNLFNLTDNNHKIHRSLIVKSLHKNLIENIYTDLVKIVNDHISKWKINEELDLVKESHELIFKIDKKIILGLENNQNNELNTYIKELIKHNGIFSLPSKENNYHDNNYIQLLNYSKLFQEEVYKLISNLEKTETLSVLKSLYNLSKTNNEVINNQQITSHIYALFSAGHDTSSSALIWTLFLLITHQEVLNKLLKGIKETLKKNIPNIKDLNNIRYLDNIIKESLRLFPPSSLLVRICQRKYQIGYYQIPKGSIVFLSQYITHRNSEIFESPNSFLPERWDSISPSNYEYFPFGAGAHTCVGQSLGILKIKLIVTILLQSFHLSLTSNLEVNRKLKITFQPEKSIPILVKEKGSFDKTNFIIKGNINESVNL